MLIQTIPSDTGQAIPLCLGVYLGHIYDNYFFQPFSGTPEIADMIGNLKDNLPW